MGKASGRFGESPTSAELPLADPSDRPTDQPTHKQPKQKTQNKQQRKLNQPDQQLLKVPFCGWVFNKNGSQQKKKTRLWLFPRVPPQKRKTARKRRPLESDSTPLPRAAILSQQVHGDEALHAEAFQDLHRVAGDTVFRAQDLTTATGCDFFFRTRQGVRSGPPVANAVPGKNRPDGQE